MKKLNKKGFTLLELMTVVAIIGILAITVLPKFTSLLTRAQEGRIKGNLAQLRSAINIYYSDTEGVYPTDAEAALTDGTKYLSKIPEIQIPAVADLGNPGHSERAGISTTSDDMLGGAWLYFPSGNNRGEIAINCLHFDSRGTLWSTH